MSDATYWKPIIHTEYEALCACPGYKRTPLMVEAVDGGWVSVADYMALKLKLDEFAAQPPCGADGAAEQGDIPDSVLLKAYTTASAGEILSHSWRPIFLRYARIGIAAAMRAMEAAPVAPATVAPEADPFGVDADLCGELHELDTDIGYRAASRIGQLAMLAASQREGGGT